MKNRKILISYAIKYNGDYKKILKAYTNKEHIEIIEYTNAITILDDDYPKRLLELDYPPLVLFYKGNKQLLNTECIGIVGSRIVSEYGTNMTKYITNKLKNKYTIVSGLAKGVDSIAHNECIKNGNTIGVLGCGIDYIYPKSNELLYKEMIKNHLILSEYPYNTLPNKLYFPFRNRIISALSNKLIVTSAKERSGTMITVNQSLKLNKDIYCVPYHCNEIDGIGCNRLILEGANILLTDDINLL